MENENLYVNVSQLFALTDCIKVKNPNYKEIINEIQDLVIDLKWKEIEEK